MGFRLPIIGRWNNLCQPDQCFVGISRSELPRVLASLAKSGFQISIPTSSDGYRLVEDFLELSVAEPRRGRVEFMIHHGSPLCADTVECYCTLTDNAKDKDSEIDMYLAGPLRETICRFFAIFGGSINFCHANLGDIYTTTSPVDAILASEEITELHLSRVSTVPLIWRGRCKWAGQKVHIEIVRATFADDSQVSFIAVIKAFSFRKTSLPMPSQTGLTRILQSRLST